MVGESAVASDTVGHAFMWQNGVMTDLGVLPETDSSFAQGINEHGQAVGRSYGGTTPARAFLWDEINGLQDLNDMLDASAAGWTLKGAVDINNAGQIVGWGINPDGSQHGYLLTVVPEPSTFVLLGMGAVGLLAHALRRRK